MFLKQGRYRKEKMVVSVNRNRRNKESFLYTQAGKSKALRILL